MPLESRKELLWLILFVLLIGLVLIVTVMLLMRTWRRQLLRERSRRAGDGDAPDIWKTGGERLLAGMANAKDDPFDGPDHDRPGDDEQWSPDDEPQR